MNLTASCELFAEALGDFSPEKYAAERSLGLYSAAIALADDEMMVRAAKRALEYEVSREALYEVVLQSYLFLGFPRMLGAAEVLARLTPADRNGDDPARVSESEVSRWFDDGENLCRKIYGPKYDDLKKRVTAMAPEIFRWMIFEGYGKVLSRPGLDPATRELSIVAFLMMENRPRQLYSHIRGALNVGTPADLLLFTIRDVGPAAGDGYAEARAMMAQLGVG